MSRVACRPRPVTSTVDDVDSCCWLDTDGGGGVPCRALVTAGVMKPLRVEYEGPVWKVDSHFVAIGAFLACESGPWCLVFIMAVSIRLYSIGDGAIMFSMDTSIGRRTVGSGTIIHGLNVFVICHSVGGDFVVQSHFDGAYIGLNPFGQSMCVGNVNAEFDGKLWNI